jgi:hypothetical protein
MALNTLQDTVNYIRPFARYQAANIGVSNQPILGIASLVRNIILAAPMIWDFNRFEDTSITLTAGLQDYTTAFANFGYLETASLLDPASAIWFEIPDVKNNSALAKSSTKARPQTISVQNSTGPVLRFSAVPDKAYQLAAVYQLSSVKFATLTDSWAPIPDSFSDVYNNMVMGYYMDSCQDPRAPQYISRGIAGLLARQSGLSDMDKAIFMQGYLNLNSAVATQAMSIQQGKQALGAR